MSINPVEYLSSVIALETRFREAPKDELGFILINETQALVPYRQAVLFQYGKLRLISGTDVIEPSDYTDRLKALVGRITEDGVVLDSVDDVAPHVLLIKKKDVVVAYCRNEPFLEQEVNTLSLLLSCYYTSLYVVEPKKRRNRWVLPACCVGVLALFFPVHSVTYSRGEVDVTNPSYIRSSLSGVIQDVEVLPNHPVHKGDVLVRLDNRLVLSDLEVAKDALGVAKAQYEDVVQEGMTDDKARKQVRVLEDKIQEEQAKVTYQTTLLSKSVLKAPSDGIAMFNDRASLIGHPVSVGENIMVVSSPSSNRLKIYTPVDDVTSFDTMASVRFFDNVQPLSPHYGHRVSVGYEPQTRPDGTLIYQDEAVMDMSLRPGIQGTVEIYGGYRPLVLWLLRKPIAYILPRLG